MHNSRTAVMVFGLFWIQCAVWGRSAICAAETGFQTPVTEGVLHCHVALRGYVREASTHEPLAYAGIFVQEAGRGAMTDENGYFSMADLCENTSYTVEVSHVECAHLTQMVRLTENTTVDFDLVHDAVLKEVVVVEKAVAPPPTQARETVDAADLEAAKGLSLSETLKKVPGVALLNSGGTIAKPVIQGLYGNRIVLVSDGVTLQSQQWGNDHAPEIDPFTADVVQVVKGAAGVRYGVGAMAGAVVMEPAPLRETAGSSGWCSAGGFSNGRSGYLAGSIDWKPRQGKWPTIRLQGSGKRSGNLRAPNYWLGNTGAAELNFSAGARWKYGKWQHVATITRFSQHFGILRAAHTGSIDDLKAAIAADTPRNNLNYFSYLIDRPAQQVEHYTAKYKGEYRIGELWKATAQYNFQYNLRQEYDRVRSNSSASDKAQVSFQLWSNTLDLSLEHLPIHHFQGAFGVQALQQLNYVGKGGFIPDYTGWGASIWGIERWRRYPIPWEFEAGLRLDYRGNHATTTGNGTNNLDKRLSFANASGTGGAIYHFSERLTARMNTGYAWRPPHVNELYAKGVHHGAGRYEQGNPELKPEKAWNSNMGLEWNGNRCSGSISGFYNRVNDFIYLDQPLDSVVLTIRGPYPAYFYRQDDAVLRGADFQIAFRCWGPLWLEGKSSILRGYRQVKAGENRDAHHDWLPLMPVDRFQYGIKWDMGKGKDRSENSYLRLGAVTALRQTRIPKEGLTKAAPAGFTLLNLEASRVFTLKHDKAGNATRLEIGLSLQNLGNVAYREYLDLFRYFADMPGFNAGIRAKYHFGA